MTFLRLGQKTIRTVASKTMNAPPWREAASLILGCQSPVTDTVESRSTVRNCDYRLLMVKRSQLSSFMANAYVYPGGLSEKSDFALDWYKTFAQCGVSPHQLLNEFVQPVEGPRPPMVTKPITLTHNEKDVDLKQFIPADIGFRITAIREAFEETGVLLLTRAKPDAQCKITAFEENVDQNVWRQKLRSEPRALLDLCIEHKLCPNIWALHEWSDWLTPVSVGHRRYDTMFYLTCLDQTPNVVLDQSEVVTLRWTSPTAMLEEYSSGSLFLAPPQVYEMSRLANLTTYSQLCKFVRERSNAGVDRWMPVIGAASDGVVSLLPGDDLYPAEPDILGKGPGPEYPFSLEEMRNRCTNLNRLDVQGPFATAHCNINIPRGLPPPITFVGTSQLNFQSML